MGEASSVSVSKSFLPQIGCSCSPSRRRSERKQATTLAKRKDCPRRHKKTPGTPNPLEFQGFQPLWRRWPKKNRDALSDKRSKRYIACSDVVREAGVSSPQSPLGSVSPCGKNCVRSLAAPLPTKPTSLGFCGGPFVGSFSAIPHTQKIRTPGWVSVFLVREAGVEPARPCEHWHLKPASLPIPPLAQVVWCSAEQGL